MRRAAMKAKGKRQKAKGKRQEGGFSLVELMVAMTVCLVIGGAVALLLGKSQTIFRAEQGVSEMDQNARLMMDFLTRDIQQSKENGLGLGQRFRTIYSKDGADGKTDEVTIITADTQTKIPTGTLPLVAGWPRTFSVNAHYDELLPGGAGRPRAPGRPDGSAGPGSGGTGGTGGRGPRQVE